jgi:hypothetical protein
VSNLGNNIIYTSGTNTLNTVSNPTFTGGIQNSYTVGSTISYGTSARNDGSQNVFLGHQSGQSSTSNNQTAVGFQSGFSGGFSTTAVGYASGYQSQSQYNISIGANAGQSILTGLGYNIHIGGTPSSNSVENETVIGSGYVGKGSNTCFIPNTSGCYFYIPAFAYLYWLINPNQPSVSTLANQALPFVTSISRSGAGSISNVNGKITMGVIGYYRISVSIFISVAGPVPAQFSQWWGVSLNGETVVPATFTYTNLSTGNSASSMNCILKISNITDYFFVYFNQNYTFSPVCISWVSVDWIGL